jgi:hypothetical protein
VETERASRYLDQLCRHVSKVSEEHAQMQATVEWSEDRALIAFAWGSRCTLRAERGVLSLRAEAPDEESLRRVQDRMSERLERFGRRDQVTVSWTSPHGAAEPRRGSPESHEAASRERGGGIDG